MVRRTRKVESGHGALRYDGLGSNFPGIAALFGLGEKDVESVVIQQLAQLVKRQYLEDHPNTEVEEVVVEKNTETKCLEFYILRDNLKEYIQFDPRRREAAEFSNSIVANLDAIRAAREYEVFSKKKGTVVKGIIEREEFTGYVVDLGKFDKFRARGFLPKNETINNNVERVKLARKGEPVMAYLSEIKIIDPKANMSKRVDDCAPRIVLSRTRTEFLEELLKMHCYEIQDGIVEIKRVAREPGVRAKIAVTSNRREIDPVGACVGPHGTRIKPIKEELSDERIDLVHWDPDFETFIRRILEPAHIVSCTIHNPVTPDGKLVAEVVIAEGRERAIGKGGVNARLASYLADCRINILERATARSKVTSSLKEHFQNDLGIDEELTALLLRHGYSSSFAIIAAGVERLTNIPDIDEELAADLFERALECEQIEIERLKGEFGVEEDLIEFLREKNLLYLVYNLLEFDVNSLDAARTSYKNVQHLELHSTLTQIFE